MTVTGQSYTNTRPRGFADWRPQAKTRLLLDQVDEVLVEYRRHLPLSARQVFYRLVGAYGRAKTESAYENLCDKLNRARRAGLVDWAAIRDDGVTEEVPPGYSGTEEFIDAVTSDASLFRLDRQIGQPVRLECWVEAAGMVPQVASVAGFYGIPVFSSGGFDSVTAKYQAGGRMAARSVPTVVLHIGDHDPSGCAVIDSAAEDVTAFALGCDGLAPEFVRVAVTPEQVSRFGLETAPPKATDRRGNWAGLETVQAEALAPDQLAAEVRTAINSYIDPDVLEDVIDSEREQRAWLVEWVNR